MKNCPKFGHPPSDESRSFASFPEYSSGFVVTKFGIDFIKINGIDELFLGSWLFKPLIPSILASLAIIGYFLACYFFFSWFTHSIFFMITDGIFLFLFLVSFFRLIFDGPGYYPFYWSQGETPYEITSNKDTLFKCKFDPTPDGIISNDSQLQWARQHKRPPRCIVSKTARRIVIRPDHYCFFGETWIGKRNAKFFCLFSFYELLYTGFISICGIFCLKYYIASNPEYLYDFWFYFQVVGEFVALSFMSLGVAYTLSSFINLIKGVTTFELENDIPLEKIVHSTIKENIEDVMGPLSKWYLYLLPFYSPWNDVPNDQLIIGYKNYYEDQSI